MKARKESGRARFAMLGAIAGIVGYRVVERIRSQRRAARYEDVGGFVYGLSEGDAQAEQGLAGREIYGHAISPRLVPPRGQRQQPIEHPDDRVDPITEHGEIAKAEYSPYWSPEQRIRAAEPGRETRREARSDVRREARGEAKERRSRERETEETDDERPQKTPPGIH